MKPSPEPTRPAQRRALDILAQCLAAPGPFTERLHIPLRQSTVLPLAGSQVHDRPELFFMAGGINRIEFPNERHDLRAGHACLIPQGTPHRETFLRVKGRMRMLVVMFRTDHVAFLINDQSVEPLADAERHGIVETAQAVRLAEGFTDLALLAASANPWALRAREALGSGLTAWLAALFSGQPTPPRYSSVVSRAIHDIEIRLEDPRLGTTAIAGRVGCVPDYLSARFHRETGIAVIPYIHRQRLAKACYLLAHSDARIKEIAPACGFDNPDYFARLFKRATGRAPRQYRASGPMR